MFPTRNLNFKEVIKLPELKEDGSNACDFFSPDVLGSKRFVNNYAGWPRSDLATINAQTDLGVARSMAMQLEDFSSDSPNPNTGLTDTEIALTGRSKYCQSPSEQIAYYERMVKFREERQVKLATRKAEEEKINTINFEENKE